MNEARRQREPLFPTTRQLPGQLSAAMLKPQSHQALFDGDQAVRHVIDAGDEIEIFTDA